MTDEQRTTERWALVGAGQCGRRVAAAVCERTADRGVCDRTVLVDTSSTPGRRTLDRVASALAVERSTAFRDHLVTFDSESGLGQTIFDDPGSTTAEVASLAESLGEATAGANAAVYVLGLGGNVGNSVVPRVIDRLSRSTNGAASADSDPESGATGGPARFALGVWPFEYEPPRRHFDAVCGLSRLLRRENGTPNADMTLLASNSRLAEMGARVSTATAVGPVGGRSESNTDEFAWSNDVIADAIRLFVGSGQTPHDTGLGTIPADLPDRCDVSHGTVGIAPAKPIGIGLQYAIQRAVENAFVPVDLSTVGTAHVVVRAPSQRVEAGDVTERDVREAVAAWSSAEHHPGPTGEATLSAVPGDGHTVDVLAFLGGFDLSPLLSTSWDAYETFKAGLIDHAEEPKSDVLVERSWQLEANLRTYCDALDRA